MDLIVDGEVVDFATGDFSGILNWTSWDVSEYVGQEAQVRIRDASTSGNWGHIFVDRIEFADEAFTPTQLSPTAVNLIVDGERVATASGNFNEVLDWKGWDVSQYVGKEAQIEILDYNTGAWGHINLDAITFADSAYRTSEFLADWIDYGADHYATISWHNLPEGEDPTVISWMNNWTYGASIPTGDFRGAMTLPRTLSLREVDGEVRVIQTPVEDLQDYRREHFTATDVTVDGTLNAPLDGMALEIVAVFDALAASADRFGLKVRVGEGEQTLVGYDATTGEVFVDRTGSGVIPSPLFGAVHAAPLEVMADGSVKLHIFVDAASVELFANEGLRTITDQIFPDEDSVGVEIFAEGGSVDLASLDMWRLSLEDDLAEAPRRYTGTDEADLLVQQEGAKGAISFDGMGGDDWIQGGAFNDRIDGGMGDDDIDAGGGRNNIVAGGIGSDVFHFRTADDGMRDRTTIRDFEVGIDHLALHDTEVVRERSIGNSTILTLDGDGDMIILTGVADLGDSWLA